MHDHLTGWCIGAVCGAIAALSTRVQLLPDVIDLSIIPTGAGFGSLLACAIGATCRLDADRLARVALLGTLGGAAATTFVVALAVIL